MKKNLPVLVITLALTFLIGCKKDSNEQRPLVIYVYSSMSWIKEEIIPTFEQQTNSKVIVNSDFIDTGDMLAKAMLEKKSPKADILMGITPSLLLQVKKEKLLSHYFSKEISKITKDYLIFDKEHYVTPFDYGALAVIINPDKVNSIDSFNDLFDYKKKLVIQDPRSSSTGLDFLLWTIAIDKENWVENWKNLKPVLLSVTSGWNESFAKFSSGEADMMVSYATDPAYSFYNYQSVSNKALIFDEGGYIQIEAAGIVSRKDKHPLSEAFIDFLLTEDFQKHIALNQWMFPATDVQLPECFDYAIQPEKVLTVDDEVLSNIESYLKQWEETQY